MTKRLGATLLGATALLLLTQGAALAGHPLGTEDAGTLGTLNTQVEFNLEQAHGRNGARETAIGNTYTVGIAPKVDFAASFTWLRDRPDAASDSTSGLGDTEVTLKWTPIEGKGFVPSVGIKAGASLPTGNDRKGLGNGRASCLFTAIADWEIDKLLLHLNVGDTLAGRPIGSSDRDDALHAALAGEYTFLERYTAVAEYLWEKNTGASGAASSEFTLGGKVALPAGITLDAGVRYGTTNASPNVTYLAGLTLNFNTGTPAAPEGNRSPDPALHPAP